MTQFKRRGPWSLIFLHTAARGDHLEAWWQFSGQITPDDSELRAGMSENGRTPEQPFAIGEEAVREVEEAGGHAYGGS